MSNTESEKEPWDDDQNAPYRKTGGGPYAVLIAALGQCGRLDEGRRALEQVVKLRPDFSLSFVRETHLLNDANNIEQYLDGLRKVGVPS